MDVLNPLYCDTVVPLVTYSDFEKALKKAHGSVAGSELTQFVDWTEEFGQEG